LANQNENEETNPFVPKALQAEQGQVVRLVLWMKFSKGWIDASAVNPI
jgi:hypothetical protein